MTKATVADWDATAANNTDVGGIALGEGVMAMSKVNDAFREMMAQISGAGFITSSVTVFADDVFAVKDNSDATKKVALQVSGVTTGTTRTLTVPDASGTIALTSNLSSYMATASYPTLTGLEGLSLVSGDVLYATAADTLARLAKGTNGQFLSLSTGLPAWANVPSSFQPIATSGTYAVGTLALVAQSSGGTITDGGTVAGTSLKLANPGASAWQAIGGAQTGTWKNVTGDSVSNTNCGYFVRTA